MIRADVQRSAPSSAPARDCSAALYWLFLNTPESNVLTLARVAAARACTGHGDWPSR